MNILIEGMSRQLGGMEAFIMSVYRGLDRENYHMDFIAYDDEIVFEEELKAGGSKVYHVTPRSKSVLQSRKELDIIFKQTQYDVFWTNKTSKVFGRNFVKSGAVDKILLTQAPGYAKINTILER